MPELVLKGFELAALGMGTVFIFLTLLVLATMTMSKFVSLTSTVDPAPTNGPQNAGNITIDPARLAVITAAVHQHRKHQALNGNNSD